MEVNCERDRPLRDLMFHLCSMKITLIPQKEEQLRVTEYIGD